ncbi:tyrosine-type recombinase/integrase [bacterium]|nr:tyrosine-type recombinase/integrase [bacterium]MBT3795439.1 tyrosine-type recombinase/integrase [bacterium]MBT4633994.1 tyrosine-type recombinase/integrase [bacterium]
MTLRKFLDVYKKSLKTKGKSDNTISLYSRDIIIYLEKVDNFDIDTPYTKFIPHFQKEKILNYFTELKNSYKKRTDGVEINKLYRTLNRKLSGFSKFLDFLVREKEIKENFLNGFDRTNIIKKNREVISRNYTKWIPEEELSNFVHDLIENLKDNPASYNIQRDTIIILLLIFTGLRASELNKIKLIDLDLENNFIHNVRRKRGVISEIPIEKYYLKPLLLNYLIIRSNLNQNSSEYLFITKNGLAIDRHLVYRAVSKFSKIFLGRRIHPHILRHTFATVMCMNGANISDVRDMLDHKNISSTELYEHVNKIKNKYDVINNFASTDKLN